MNRAAVRATNGLYDSAVEWLTNPSKREVVLKPVSACDNKIQFSTATVSPFSYTKTRVEQPISTVCLDQDDENPFRD